MASQWSDEYFNIAVNPRRPPGLQDSPDRGSALRPWAFTLRYKSQWFHERLFSRITMSLLKISGTKIVNEQGNEVVLRGAGLGGWMKSVNSLFFESKWHADPMIY